MAGGQLSLTRRALLGAAFAPVAFSRHPGLDPGPRNTAAPPARPEVFLGPGFRRDDGRWEKALARFAAAEACPERSRRAAIAAAAGAPDHVYDPIGARHHAALLRLLRTPAPTLAALARKLDLALDERTLEFFGDEAAMRILKQDARRLAAPAA